MLNTDAKSLKERGDSLFSAKQVLDTRNQEIAENFYPERADFTVERDLGEDWAEDLMTGYPAMVRRDLGNAISTMLRPRSTAWFEMISKDRDDVKDMSARKWMEFATGVQRRALYDKVSRFTRATKEGDHDFAAFGGCVIQCEMNMRDVALLFRNWHMRDVAWQEDAYGDISQVHRNWNPTAEMLSELFGQSKMAGVKGLHPQVTELLKDRGTAKRPIKTRHIMISAEEYGATDRYQTPWVSLYIDCENDHIMAEVGSWTRQYIIPRWMTISGSQYPYSPAALIALPDARLIQSMTFTLLQAGEKATDPPLIGVQEAIRGDLDMRPGGFTPIDAAYDERLGEVLRPMTIDKSGIPTGFEIHDRVQAMLMEAFYLNKLRLPPHGGPEMTAFEAGQRVQEYIREAMPLFEPMEHEYNGELCEMAFETLLRNGAFGPIDSIPSGVGEEVGFKFESPLSEAIERAKGQTFLESKAMIAEAMAIDEEAGMVMDFPTTLRDVLDGIGAPAKWMNDEDAVAAMQKKRNESAAAQETLAMMQQGADVAQKLGVDAQQFGSEAV